MTQLLTIPVDLIDPSPEQSRTDWGDLEGMAASIKESGGVRNRVKVRPSGARYVLSDGERRLRATKLAGLPSIEAELTEDSPRDAALDQVRCNDGKPLTAIEEGRAFARLRDVHGMSLGEIAKKTGKKLSRVESGLKLITLHPDIHALLASGRITDKAAAVLAHIAHERQAQAAEDIARLYPTGTTTVEQVKYLIDDQTNRIRLAPFDPEDDELTTAGACGQCINNTACQRDLFGHVDEDALCLLSPCWVSKTQANAARERDRAERYGLRVMDDAEVARFFDNGRIRDGVPWVVTCRDNDDMPISLLGEGEPMEDGRAMTWRDLETQLAEADKDGAAFEITKQAFAISAGHVHYLLEAPYAAGFVERTHPRRARELRGEVDPDVAAAKEERKAKKKLEADEAELLEAEMRALTNAVDEAEDSDAIGRAVAILIGWHVGPGVMRIVAKRRGLPLEEERDGSPISPADAISRHVVDADFAEAWQLMVELIATSSELDEKIADGAKRALWKAAGVDRAAVKKDLARSKRNVKTRGGKKGAQEAEAAS